MKVNLELIHKSILENKLQDDKPKDAFIRALCILTQNGYDVSELHDNLEYLYALYQLKYNKNNSPLFAYYSTKFLGRF